MASGRHSKPKYGCWVVYAVESNGNNCALALGLLAESMAHLKLTDKPKRPPELGGLC